MAEAEKKSRSGQRTIVFVDEVHRFNKAQQDAFLPYVEAGHILFIGATTENPSFEVISPLLSRTKVYVLESLTTPQIVELLWRALEDKEHGLGNERILIGGAERQEQSPPGLKPGIAREATSEPKLRRPQKKLKQGGETQGPPFATNAKDAPPATSDQRPVNEDPGTQTRVSVPQGEDVLWRMAAFANGDARAAYNTLELCVRSAKVEDGPVREEPKSRQDASTTSDGVKRITAALLEDVLQRKMLRYDKAGEEHYNLISALHKSVRNSDPDAALYWLARMIESGEDALYLARRMVRMASEDIGLAEPGALAVTLAAKEAFDFLGAPEGHLALAQAAVYLSLAPEIQCVVCGVWECDGRCTEDGGGPGAVASAECGNGINEEYRVWSGI